MRTIGFYVYREGSLISVHGDPLDACHMAVESLNNWEPEDPNQTTLNAKVFFENPSKGEKELAFEFIGHFPKK